MTVKQLVFETGFKIICGAAGLERTVNNNIYCCDLLSYAMGRAPTGGVWITVMGNINVVAVAALTETAAVVIADGSVPDEETVKKANVEGVVLLKSYLPVFETALTMWRCLKP